MNLEERSWQAAWETMGRTVDIFIQAARRMQKAADECTRRLLEFGKKMELVKGKR